MDTKNISTNRRPRKIDWSKYLFLLVILIVPVSCFIIFYIVVNFNSVLMAFQSYENGSFVLKGFGNFKEFFNLLGGTNGYGQEDTALIFGVRNSAIILAINVFAMLPLSLFVSYCVSEKLPFFGFFKVILFAPSIICAFALTIIGRQVIGVVIPEIFGAGSANLLNGEKQFATVLIYDLFMGFAGNMVLYIGAMSSVSRDIMEYSQIDGCGFVRRFIHVVFPAIFSTITTIMITLFTNFFVGYGSMFSFKQYSADPSANTIGYYLFVMIYEANGNVTGVVDYNAYTVAAAMGLMFTFVAIPIVFGMRYLLNRFGPRED